MQYLYNILHEHTQLLYIFIYNVVESEIDVLLYEA